MENKCVVRARVCVCCVCFRADKPKTLSLQEMEQNPKKENARVFLLIPKRDI